MHGCYFEPQKRIPLTKTLKIFSILLNIENKKGTPLHYMILLSIGFLSFTTPIPALPFFFNLTLFMTKLRVLVLCFPYFMDISINFDLNKIAAPDKKMLKFLQSSISLCEIAILENSNVKIFYT